MSGFGAAALWDAPELGPLHVSRGQPILDATAGAAGATALISAFGRFVIDGLGTPAPWDPPDHLVLGGLYRHVRNPMYVAVATTIVGQALLLGRPVLLVWAAVFAAVTATFVRVYEEPTLREQFGAEYEAYCAAVPGWWPRRRPWRPTGQP